MHIYLGSDHGGYELKALLNASLQDEGLEVTDCGSQTFEPSDYPDYAVAVATALQVWRRDGNGC